MTRTARLAKTVESALRINDERSIARLAARWPADFIAAALARPAWLRELVVVEAAARTREPARAAVLVQALAAPTPYVRVVAARALSQVAPAPDIVDALMAALGDPDALVRKAAVAALDGYNDSRTADALDAAARSAANHHAGIAKRAWRASQRLRGDRVESALAFPVAVRITAVHVALGESVAAGGALFSFRDDRDEATFCAPHAGEVVAITITAGADLPAETPALVLLGRRTEKAG